MSWIVTTDGTPLANGITPFVKWATSARMDFNTPGASSCSQANDTSARRPPNARTFDGSGDQTSAFRFEITTNSSSAPSCARCRSSRSE